MNGNGRYLPPRVLQLLGVALLVGSALFWAWTGRESVLLMSSAMTLIGIGAYGNVVASLKEPHRHRELPPPAKPPAASSNEEH